MEFFLENPTDFERAEFIAEQRKLNSDISSRLWERYQLYAELSETVESFNDWYFGE